jgi:hypothetical protein
MFKVAYNYSCNKQGVLGDNMKKTIFAIITLVSSLSFAQFDMIDTEIARTVAQLTNVDTQIKTVKLNESGVLTVVKREAGSVSIKLSETNKAELLSLAKMLTEAEVQTDIRTMVCKMMINPFTVTNLSVIDLSNNSLRLILSHSSCALGSYTYPTQEFHMDAAKSLKAQMIVLARQTIENNNYHTQPVKNLE